MSAGTVQSGASTIQSAVGLEPVLGDEPREQRLVAEPAPEAGGADHLLGAVHLGCDPEPRAGRARAARPSRAPGG